MDKQTIREEIIRYGFGDLEYDANAIDGAINIAYADIQIQGDMPFAEAGPEEIVIDEGLITAISSGDLPADYNKVRAITLDDQKLRFLDPDDFIQMQLTDTSLGTPVHYTIWDGAIKVWPAPDEEKTLKIWYHKTLPALEDDTDVPDIPERYHYLLVYGALTRLFSATDEEDKHGRYLELWNGLIEVMRNDLSQTEYDRSEVIGSSYTLGAIAKIVRESGFTELGNSTIYLMANQELRELASRHNWGWLEKQDTVTITDSDLTLPADCDKPRRIIINDSGTYRPLENILIDEYWEYYDGSDSTSQSLGTPQSYAIWDSTGGSNRVKIYPIPDREYEADLWYVSYPEYMESVTDTPPFAPQHHRIILLGVLIQAALHSVNPELQAKLSIYKNEYIELEQKMVNDLQVPSLDKPFKIQGPDF